MCLVFQGTGNFCKYLIHSNLEYYAWSIPTFLNTFFTTVNRSLLTSEKNMQQNQKTHKELLLLVKGPTVYCQQTGCYHPQPLLWHYGFWDTRTTRPLNVWGKAYCIGSLCVKYSIANAKPDQQKIQSMLSCISRAVLEGSFWVCFEVDTVVVFFHFQNFSQSP